jgi:hypothetical protein
VVVKILRNMTTVILDTRYSEAKKLLKKLRNESYAKIVEPCLEKSSNDIEERRVNKSKAPDKFDLEADLRQSLKEVKNGKVTMIKSREI